MTDKEMYDKHITYHCHFHGHVNWVDYIKTITIDDIIQISRIELMGDRKKEYKSELILRAINNPEDRLKILLEFPEIYFHLQYRKKF